MLVQEGVAGAKVRVTLDDKWTRNTGRILLNGTQAIARVFLAQRWLDERAGLNTAGYVTGYRGSPLGNVDMTLWTITDRLEAADVRFQPGVNEDIAATAVRGTQQIGNVPGPRYDGVFAAWYGKGPGVDRSGDAFKHGNLAGSHPKGGVLLIYGDDHAGKSSTVAHHSEQAIAASLVPSLYPANVGEIIEYGLLAFAMSRFSGAWVAMKCVNEVVEQTASIDIDLTSFHPCLPADAILPPEGVHCRPGVTMPLREEQVALEYRLPLVQRFVRENAIDRVVLRGARPRLGLVAAGKSYSDTRQALRLLGLDDAQAASLGISLYKVGCIWPLEPVNAVNFAKQHDVVFVIEEKQAFVEPQLAAALINEPTRPLVIGKADEDAKTLLSSVLQIDPAALAAAIVDRLERLGLADRRLIDAAAGLRGYAAPSASAAQAGAPPRRIPFFCSGCPHSRSTRVPDGSLSMTGIGCHTMVLFTRPDQALVPTHMGAEGTNWIGLAPFTDTKHVFQNMGEGTYYHSGLLAIRAAVAAKVNITYKILYNDAVAMTGGQPVDGSISVAEIANQVRHEGVETIVIVSDNPDYHRRNTGFPAGVRIEHRDALDEIQRGLREVPGCTVLIYEQTCAAEKRRRRKRDLYPDPPKRLFISKAVCEGCGDCSVQSTCVSLTPANTDFGVKRAIDQSSCNKDYSCLNGFCPSFITVRDAEPRKRPRADIGHDLYAGLPSARTAPLREDGFNVMITGIGGTGVVTVAAVLGMAAHIEGKASSMFDMTGLAQKNGAVFSHMRIADDPRQIHAQRLGRGEADLLLAFDVVGALAEEASATLSRGRTRALADSNVTETAAYQFNRNATVNQRRLIEELRGLVGVDALDTIAASRMATALLGNSIGGNMFMIGVASQKGLLPVGIEAIEQAVRLNGTAVSFNLEALQLGRLFAHDPARVKALLPKPAALPDPSLAALVERRSAHLTAYQNAAYASRYRSLVERVHAAERALGDDEVLSQAVAQNYAKLLAYKDEYEVARLLTDPNLQREIGATFGKEAKLSFNLAPPVLGGGLVNGRPRKWEFDARWTRPLLHVLARLKGLRGTVLDPFGRTRERRMERELIIEYEVLVTSVLNALNRFNHSDAVALLSLADMVRGYGPVKEEAVTNYRQKVATMRSKFFDPGEGLRKAA